MMEYPENLLTKRIIQCIIKIHQSTDQSFPTCAVVDNCIKSR
ncbi:MAG: hypothetical protein ABIJ30_06005 [bacterium]